MKYKNAASFRQALDDQLRKWAEADKRTSINRLRTQLAFERLLARLFYTGDERWVLKGGYALELRYGKRARATKDLDLNVPPPPFENLLEQLREAVERDIGDFFSFAIDADKQPLVGPPLGGHRFRVALYLDGKIFVRFALDVGQGDETVAAAQWVAGKVDLTFTELPIPRFAIYPLEDHFAEKLHAYTTPRDNPSRVKDLVDMVLMIETGLEASPLLKTSIEQTFERYARHILPASLPQPPERWLEPFATLAEEVGINTNLDEAFETVRLFLNKVGFAL